MRDTQRHSGFRSRALLLAVAITPVVVGVLSDSEVPTYTHALIALVWLLCLLPLYLYLSPGRSVRRPLPFFPALCVMYGLYFALPLTLGITDQYYNAPVDPQSDYELVVELVFLGWIAMAGAYYGLGQMIQETPRIQHIRWRPESVKRWALVFLFGGIAVTALRIRFGDSNQSGGILQFVSSLQWFGAGAVAMLGRRGELSVTYRLAAIVGILAAAALVIAGGSIAPLMMLAATVGFGLWIGRPSLKGSWIIAAVVIALFAMSLRGVAIEFRKAAWFGSSSLSQTDRMLLMLKLLQTRAERDGVVATIANGVETTGGRSANLDLFANVARRTPSEVPYWNGETYVSLVGSFVPRFLWPDKPTKELGQAFGHRYRLIYFTNTSTAINLPFLVEFYINFSTVGVILGMILVGFIYRILDSVINQPMQDPLVSLLGVVLLLPLLLMESDFSLVFGGLPLNAVALYGLYWILTGRVSKFVHSDATARGIPAGFRRPIPLPVQHIAPRLSDRSDGPPTLGPR